jgi:hypothetical protein
MADPRSTNTRRAVLSYDQLKQLTGVAGFVWPDLLIKDYQGIIQDFTFLAGETDDLEVRIEALEYRVFEVVETTTDLIAEEFQIVICKNTIPIEVELKPLALKGDELHIKRAGDIVEVIGQVDGLANLTINVPLFSLHLVFNGTDWSQI